MIQAAPARSQALVSMAARRFEDWAEAVGVECCALPETQKQDHIHEFGAIIGHLCGIEEKHLIHIFETFHEGWDHAERLAATRKGRPGRAG